MYKLFIMKTKNIFLKYRWLTIILFLGLTVLLGIQLPKAKIDPEVMNLLPEDMPSRIQTDSIEAIFGGTDLLVVVLKTDDVLKPETLKRLKLLSKKANRLSSVDDVMSLFDLKSIKGDDGMMIVDPAVNKIPKTNEAREVLRKEIKDNDIVHKVVVSEDFTLTTLILTKTPEATDIELIGEVEQMLHENPGNEEVYMAGLPYVRYNEEKDIKKDMMSLMPLGLLIMLVFLFFSFREIKGVILPFSIVVISIIVALGSIPALSWKIMMPTIILPIMLIAIANDYGIHLIARYQELNKPGGKLTNKEIAKKVFSDMWRPIAITGLTTIIGMLCLLFHRMIPAKQLGVLASIGIAFALLASLFLIPITLSFIKKGKPRISAENDKKTGFERFLFILGEKITQTPRRIVLFAVIIVSVAALGIFMLKVDSNPENYYTEEHPIQVGTQLINKKLGGSQAISLVVNGDIKDPAILKKMDNYEKEFEKIPTVGNVISINDIVHEMGTAINDPGDPLYDKIPDSREAVAQYFELYSMSGDPEDFEKMVDFPFENAQITTMLNTGNTPDVIRTISQINEIIKDDKDVSLKGGLAMIIAELSNIVVNGQVTSLLVSVLMVVLVMSLLFKSVKAGLISAIPLSFSMIILFGLMGYLNIDLNIATAMLSSIMIGVGIDYTIHILWRYKEERQNGLDYKTAIVKTLVTTGRGVTINALSVIIGFSALFISSFLPVKFFGFLVVVSISACLIGALVIIPAICLIIKPKFLEPKEIVQ